MALRVKTVDKSTEKWAERAGGAAMEFAAEAEAAAERWAANTVAAKDNYRAGISSAGIADRFSGGVKRAGSAKFSRKIRDVAADRYAPGVNAGKGDYKERVEPFLSTIAGLTLAPRKPRGDISNLNRVAEVGKALHAKRLALLGVSAGGA